jgi:hypothetical protein
MWKAGMLGACAFIPMGLTSKYPHTLPPTAGWPKIYNGPLSALLQATAQSPGVQASLHHHMYPHSSDIPALLPTAAPQSDPLLLRSYMFLHSNDNHSPVPTATHLTALLEQL